VDDGHAEAEVELPWCPLVPPQPVELPEDISDAKLYVERALLGFAGLVDDLNPACMSSIAHKYKVREGGDSECVPVCSPNARLATLYLTW
jgi:hypothetical protein